MTSSKSKSNSSKSKSNSSKATVSKSSTSRLSKSKVTTSMNSRSKKKDKSILVKSDKKSKKRKSSKNSKQKLNYLETIIINDRHNNINKYIPPKSSMIRPKIWELPNRKRFYPWVEKTFSKYNSLKQSTKTDKRAQALDKINLNKIQQLTRDFMQGESPYRGLLLYLGLGVGKTCAAIAISEAIQNKKEVLILSKASLERNFINDILRCGAEYMTKNNYWVFSKCQTESEKKLADDLNIPESIINENGGMYLIDFTIMKSNYKSLSKSNQIKLNKQIEATIKDRYKFLHLDDTRLLKKIKPEIFDNKVIVIDEVHNVTNNMTSGSARGEEFYKIFMEAKNSKFVFLSGTPLINSIFEATRLFNILRGYIPVVEIKIKTDFNTEINYQSIKTNLKKHPCVDQIIINKVNKLIKISKLPENFINSPDNKGIIYKPDKDIDNESFHQEICKILQKLGYKFFDKLNFDTCLPEDVNEFQRTFHNIELNKIKKPEVIKKRLAGLTSFYKYQDKNLFPELKLPINIVRVPMSEFQLGQYEKYRHQEIQKSKQSTIKKGKEETFSTSYRIKSRLSSTFVFPEEIGNPYDLKDIEILEGLQDKMIDLGDPIDVDVEDSKKAKAVIKSSFLKILDRDRDKYLSIKNESLLKHSPKYYSMIKNIKNTPGTVLVYSQFRSLIGLNTFSFALEHNADYLPLKIKKVSDLWELDLDKNDPFHKKKSHHQNRYCFFTGNEKSEEREIYRKIFNGLWEELDPSCAKLVKQLKKMNQNNNYGEVVKVLMTTRTGAEGLNLKNVRQVHIMEPYWQPVLIEQVIGRAVRTESHISLPKKDRNVEVFIYMATIEPNMLPLLTHIDVRRDVVKLDDNVLYMKGKVATSDEYLYIISERKKKIINEFQHLMIESAFNCNLNYGDNTIQNDNIVCLDYETQNRDEYLYTPDVDDTIDIMDIAQEKLITVTYKEVTIKGKKYYYNPTPNGSGKIYLYDDKLVKSTKLPKPVGLVIQKEGKTKFAFIKK